jgi:hypothetical protein
MGGPLHVTVPAHASRDRYNQSACPFDDDWDPKYQYNLSSSLTLAAWLTPTKSDGSNVQVVVTFGVIQRTVTLIYVDASLIKPDASPSSSAQPGGADVSLTAVSTCSQYLAADETTKGNLIASIKGHLTVTFGSNTVTTFVQVLDRDCPDQPSQTVENLLSGLGYYGR